MKPSGITARGGVQDASDSSATPAGMVARLIFGACLVLLMSAAAAQTQDPIYNIDYYLHKSDPAVAYRLKTVETYHLQPAIDKMRMRFYSGAWGDVDFILRYFPNHPQGLMLMVKLCEAWRDPKCNTEHYFDKAVSVSPNAPGIYVTRGITLHRNKRLPEAIANYKKALALSPDSLNAHFNLALAYLAQKEYAAANEHAQQAYALGLTLPGLRNQLVAVGAWKTNEVKPAEPAQPTVEAPVEAVEPAVAEAQPANAGHDN